MKWNLPRHARHHRKRHHIERADAVAIVIGVLSIVINVLVGIGVISPSAGHAVAPGPVTVCIAVRAPAYCPAAVNRSTSP
jgi:hypothetical protein